MQQIRKNSLYTENEISIPSMMRDAKGLEGGLA